jgi:uncharacterized surface protein with fasciclin (FAS1) repeats
MGISQRIVVVATLFSLVGLSGESQVTARAGAGRAASRREKPARGILGTASEAGNFRTLINAVVAADLFDDLREDGPFTIFAPTDEAFAKLPASELSALLKPEKRDALRKLLTLHIVGGRLTAETLANHGSPKTLNGAKLTIAANRHGLAVNEATVIKADIACRNGIIHVIDKVLMPSASSTDLLSLAESKKSFQTLSSAIKAAGLEETLRGDGPFTVLAPTDEAFAKLPKATLASLLKPANRGKLAEILKYHVISGKVDARSLVAQDRPRTLQGSSIKVTIDEGRLFINGAKVLSTDIAADNGILHVIDAVLIPE